MTRALAVILGLLLLSLPAASQQVPDPLSRSELNTVKSQGGTPPNNVITNFYDDYGRIQHQIASQPEAAEYSIEQAGITGSGATRVCLGANPNVDCNYMATGMTGKHTFGGGAGVLADMQHLGTGITYAWPRLLSTDRLAARLEAHADSFPDVDLELRAQGVGAVHLMNANETIARFITPLPAAPGYFTFSGGLGPGGPLTISGEPNGMHISGLRAPMRPTSGDYTIPTAESAYQYHNTGAGAPVIYTLPPSVQGLTYCFSVHAAHLMTVQASGSDRIAVANLNSIAGGKITATQPFASICIVCTLPGQWVTRSTADKAQWTVL